MACCGWPGDVPAKTASANANLTHSCCDVVSQVPATPPNRKKHLACETSCNVHECMFSVIISVLFV